MSRTRPHNPRLPPGADLLPEPEIALATLTPPLDLEKLFASSGHFELEIGIGKGRFLLAQAAAHPGTRYLGIERAVPYLRFVRHRILQHGLGNVRLLSADARDAVRRLLPDHALRATYIFFPDPWPKRRQRCRRLLDPAFAAELPRILAPGGEIHVVTDDADYATQIEAALAAVPAFERAAAFRLEDIAGRTHFAAKLAARNGRFHAFSWIHRA